MTREWDTFSPQERIDRIRDGRSRGLYLRQIAQELGASYGTIAGWVTKYRIILTERAYFTPEEDAAILEGTRQGLSCAAIARSIGRSGSSVGVRRKAILRQKPHGSGVPVGALRRCPCCGDIFEPPSFDATQCPDCADAGRQEPFMRPHSECGCALSVFG